MWCLQKDKKINYRKNFNKKEDLGELRKTHKYSFFLILRLLKFNLIDEKYLNIYTLPIL